jgi:uncharacterized protein YecE (DUF72 family)
MIRIGTSGFSFPDWKGVVYPPGIRSGEMLPYYAHRLGFTSVEINATYYSLPTPATMHLMTRKVPEGFEFVIKANRGMTHDPFDDRSDRPSAADTRDIFKSFAGAIGAVREAGMLGGVLLQFPVFFRPSPGAREYMLSAQEQLPGMPLIVEFRNGGWAREETFTFLEEHGFGYCAVDEPQLPRLMPFINRVTSPVAYMRFHGRNPHWFNAPVAERYDYSYTAEELKPFVPEVQAMDVRAGKTYVFFNNCHAGAAAKNARTFALMLKMQMPAGDAELFPA